jgi:hypothetical protein
MNTVLAATLVSSEAFFLFGKVKHEKR